MQELFSKNLNQPNQANQGRLIPLTISAFHGLPGSWPTVKIKHNPRRYWQSLHSTSFFEGIRIPFFAPYYSSGFLFAGKATDSLTRALIRQVDQGYDAVPHSSS